MIWVHDYHLIPLAAELRALGCRQRIGFFLHIPLPPPLILAAIPGHEWLMRALFAYDLVGLQSQADLGISPATSRRRPTPRRWAATTTVPSTAACVRAFPIGIDVDEFPRLARRANRRRPTRRCAKQYAQRQLLVGVDRLDYSKGLPQRLRAFRELLARYPRTTRARR